jgi:CIC family chloride channel protein
LVKVVMIADKSFSQLSGSMSLLKETVASAAKRRSTSLWEKVPAAQSVLTNAPLSDFIEPLPVPPLIDTASYESAIRLFNSRGVDVCYVVDARQALVGAITHRDLFDAVQKGASRETPAAQFMSHAPLFLLKTDSTVSALSTMREHTLRWLPVVESQAHPRLIGYVRAQRMLERVVTGTVLQPAGR